MHSAFLTMTHWCVLAVAAACAGLLAIQSSASTDHGVNVSADDEVRLTSDDRLSALQTRQMVDKKERYSSFETASIDLPFTELFTENGELTGRAQKQIQLLNEQMQSMPLSLKLEVASPPDVACGVRIARLLSTFRNQHAECVSIGLNLSGNQMKQTLRLTFVRQEPILQ